MARDTRKTLIDYCYKEIQKYGYFEASTTNILKKAKIPKGSMYHYFNSKKDLAVAVINEKLEKESIKALGLDIDDFDKWLEFLKEIDFNHKSYRYNLILHSLYTEVANIDDDFKIPLDGIFKELTSRLINLLSLLNKNREQLSTFVLSSLIGLISLKDRVGLDYLIDYLESLKDVPKKRVKANLSKKSKTTNKIKSTVVQGSLF